MTKTLAGLICAYRDADPQGGAAEWLEEDARSHRGFAELACDAALDTDHPDEEKQLLATARESEAGARLLRHILWMRLPTVELRGTSWDPATATRTDAYTEVLTISDGKAARGKLERDDEL
jgi:hypothetical protein